MHVRAVSGMQNDYSGNYCGISPGMHFLNDTRSNTTPLCAKVQRCYVHTCYETCGAAWACYMVCNRDTWWNGTEYKNIPCVYVSVCAFTLSLKLLC